MLRICNKSDEIVFRVYSEAYDESTYTSFKIKSTITFEEVQQFIKLLNENMLCYLDDSEFVALNSSQFFDSAYTLRNDDYPIDNYVYAVDFDDDLFFIEYFYNDQDEDEDEDGDDYSDIEHIDSFSTISDEVNSYKVRFIKKSKEEIKIVISNDLNETCKLDVQTFLELFR
jgi:hypothetical protein